MACIGGRGGGGVGAARNKFNRSQILTVSYKMDRAHPRNIPHFLAQETDNCPSYVFMEN